MLIERAALRSRTFNLDDRDQLADWNELLGDPSIRIVTKKFFNHTETSDDGDSHIEIKDQRVYAEWETCSL